MLSPNPVCLRAVFSFGTNSNVPSGTGKSQEISDGGFRVYFGWVAFTKKVKLVTTQCTAMAITKKVNRTML